MSLCAAKAWVQRKKLTQSILAKAFRGELVHTEAELARREGRSYEPASALLARIIKENGVKSKLNQRNRSKKECGQQNKKKEVKQ